MLACLGEKLWLYAPDKDLCPGYIFRPCLVTVDKPKLSIWPCFFEFGERLLIKWHSYQNAKLHLRSFSLLSPAHLIMVILVY